MRRFTQIVLVLLGWFLTTLASGQEAFSLTPLIMAAATPTSAQLTHYVSPAGHENNPGQPSSLAAGVTYYVSASSGNDDWPGTSAQPWKTLAKVSTMTFQPNDQILLKRGDVWDGEELVLRGSGNFMDGAWITVGSYGAGHKPRLTNPPADLTPGLVDWSAVNETYPGTERETMKIAVRIDGGSGWKLTGLEIDQAEMGIFAPAGGAGFWIEDVYLHDISGLLMPAYPNFEASCEVECPMWNPFPTPAWGSAIEVHGDYVTIKDVVIERATGGITGYANVGLIENVFIDKVTTGGLTFGGHAVTMRYVTVLNAEWPEGAWFGADPVMSSWDTGLVVERSEFAYSNNHAFISDASPLDFDQESVNSVVRDNFFHDNIGSALEFNLAGENHLITIENNVAYHNGLEDDPRPGADYLKVAFAADACGYPDTSYTIKDNVIYKAFPGQYLNYYFNFAPYFANDFSLAEANCQYTVSNNTVFEYGEYTLPLPVPAPPPTSQTNIATSAEVTVSSGGETAWLAQDGLIETEWISAEAQPWIKYTWGSPQTVDRIRLFDRPDLENWATSAILTFSDGSSINVTGGILNNGAMREMIFDSPKSVTWVQFTVTRNVPENPGTQVGLTEFQVYLAETGPPAPIPDPGLVTLDFSDRPDSPSLLTGLYPDHSNGIDWHLADWTTGYDSNSGNRYLYIDFPRNLSGNPATASRMFSLPAGKVLHSFSVACPVGAIVNISQGDQPTLSIDCTRTLTPYQTGWTTPAASNIVAFWLDLTAVPDKSLTDVWFDDLVYGD